MQKGFVFDINKCTGCAACQIGCEIENELEPGMRWRQIYTFNAPHYDGIPVFHHSLACNHCIDPPCMTHCPTLAYSKDAGTGAVTIDSSLCVGCRYCSWACPYDAPRVNRATGLVEKCTFCTHRLREGKEPACVALCPTGALCVSEVSTPVRRDVVGFPDTDANPAIEFIPLRDNRRVPVAAAVEPERISPSDVTDIKTAVEPRIKLRAEWPLVVFTEIVAWLVGYLGAAFLWSTEASVVIFVCVGAIGVVSGALHLGRKRRAYRAVLNWRGSWLSREVILVPLFIGLGFLYLMGGLGAPIFGWTAVGVGIVALIAADRVYHVTRNTRLATHSAQILPTGIYAAGVLGWNGGVILTMAGVKLIMYAARKRRSGKNSRRTPTIVWAPRVVLGILVPVVAWLFSPEHRVEVAVVCVVIGELIDRCEFYAELDVVSPRRRMAEDLAKEIASR